MKLPVFSAFGASISYTIAHFPTLLRITWLPALLLMAAYAYFMPAMMEMQMNMAAVDGDGADQAAMFAAMAESMKASGYIYLASAIFYPMLIAGVLRHVVRGDAPRLPFYLWFGGDEFRVLISYILLVVMGSLIGIVGFLAVMVAGIVAAVVSQAVGGVIIGLLSVAFMIAIIWFMLRMSVVFPASVGERTIGIARSWSLTKGNAWSLFFYWVLWLIVLGFIGGIYAIFAVSDFFNLIPELIAAGTDEAAQQAIEARMIEVQMHMYDITKPGYWPYMIATYLYTIISFSFSTAASGVAYRYLAGDERG